MEIDVALNDRVPLIVERDTALAETARLRQRLDRLEHALSMIADADPSAAVTMQGIARDALNVAG